jgi:hypothetical protein
VAHNGPPPPDEAYPTKNYGFELFEFGLLGFELELEFELSLEFELLLEFGVG